MGVGSCHNITIYNQRWVGGKKSGKSHNVICEWPLISNEGVLGRKTKNNENVLDCCLGDKENREVFISMYFIYLIRTSRGCNRIIFSRSLVTVCFPIISAMVVHGAGKSFGLIK